MLRDVRYFGIIGQAGQYSLRGCPILWCYRTSASQSAISMSDSSDLSDNPQKNNAQPKLPLHETAFSLYSSTCTHGGLRNFPSNGKKASVRTLSLKGAKELLRKFARAIVVTWKGFQKIKGDEKWWCRNCSALVAPCLHLFYYSLLQGLSCRFRSCSKMKCWLVESR